MKNGYDDGRNQGRDVTFDPTHVESVPSDSIVSNECRANESYNQ